MSRIILLLLAACDGVSSETGTWDDTVESFALAHCEWNRTCDNRPDNTTCKTETIGVMSMTTRAELAAGQESACVECMQAWTAAYAAASSPCVHTLPFADADAVTQACMAVNCVDNHDLPGGTPTY